MRNVIINEMNLFRFKKTEVEMLSQLQTQHVTQRKSFFEVYSIWHEWPICRQMKSYSPSRQLIIQNHPIFAVKWCNLELWIHISETDISFCHGLGQESIFKKLKNTFVNNWERYKGQSACLSWDVEEETGSLIWCNYISAIPSDITHSQNCPHLV